VDESVRKVILKEKFDMDKYVAIIDKFLEKNLLKDINDNESIRSEYIGLNQSFQNQTATHEEFTSILQRSDSTGENFKKVSRTLLILYF
jgi:hypothetical protein